MSFTANVVKVKADSSAGILPEGLAAQSVNFKFSGTDGELASAATNLEVMATIQAKVKKENDKDPPPYLADLSALMASSFGQSADSSGLFNSTQISKIELTAKAGIEQGGLKATLQAKIDAAFDSMSPSDIISVKRSASVQVSYTSQLVDFADWNVGGDISATWTDFSSNEPEIKASGTVSLENVNTGNKSLDTVLRALYVKVSSIAPGGAELGRALQENVECEFGIRWRIIQF